MNPPASGPGLGYGNAPANHQQQQSQQQQQLYEYQLFVNNRAVKFSYISTLFILMLQCKVSSFLRSHKRFLTGMYAYMRSCRQRTSRLSRMTNEKRMYFVDVVDFICKVNQKRCTYCTCLEESSGHWSLDCFDSVCSKLG